MSRHDLRFFIGKSDIEEEEEEEGDPVIIVRRGDEKIEKPKFGSYGAGDTIEKIKKLEERVENKKFDSSPLLDLGLPGIFRMNLKTLFSLDLKKWILLLLAAGVSITVIQKIIKGYDT